VSEGVRYAGFWRRAGAHLIDSLIYVPLSLVFLFAIYGPDYLVQGEEPVLFRGFWDLAINELLPLLLVIVLWRRFGATPGKRLLHCRVVDAVTFEKPGWLQAAKRSIGYFASLLPLGLGFLWIFRDKRRQGFHDWIAGTVVLYAPDDEGDKSLSELMEENR
jgi:uncharacterized RDD family membrane protein YckC